VVEEEEEEGRERRNVDKVVGRNLEGSATAGHWGRDETSIGRRLEGVQRTAAPGKALDREDNDTPSNSTHSSNFQRV
jgi:hypothetical protein